MPRKIEATMFVDDPARTLAQLRVACEQAELATDGGEDELRARLTQYLASFTEADEIVCLNPERPMNRTPNPSP